jgi:predicted porin
MKMKKLLAAAVAAAIIAPVTTLASGPILYGKLHTLVSYNDNDGSINQGEAAYSEWSMSDRSSRIGVKGTEDIGNGLKAGYVVEWAMNIDGTGNDMGQRNRAVMLQGDWGTVLAGRWDVPHKELGRKVELFSDSLGDLRNLNGDHDLRLDNVVAYASPNMSGFSATIAYSFDLGVSLTDDGVFGESTDNDAWSMNAIYDNGPVMVGVSYVQANINDVFQALGFESNQSSWRVAGSYAMGDFKVLGSYTDFSDVGWVSGNDPDVWTLGASYGFGGTTVKFQYAERSESSSHAHNGADMWVVGLDHDLSKRTNVYVTYALVDNDTNADGNPWDAGNNAAGTNGLGVPGEDADSFGIGIIHKF